MTTRLRSLAFTLVFCLASHVCFAQWVSIPDSNFGKWLNTNGYSACLQGNSTSGWQMDTTCGAVVNAITVDCSLNLLAPDSIKIHDLTGIQYFDGLDTLACGGNELISIPPLATGLSVLWCGYNQLTGMPFLPSSLTKLYCNDNQLTTLPVLPSNLSLLFCYNNQLNTMPALPGSLVDLRCDYNQLTELPTLPSSLTKLYCEDNLLDTLPPLPGNLTELRCNNNELFVLPSLPGGLIRLQCAQNQLTTLSVLPSSLVYLHCYNNALTSLPALPDSLIELYCAVNQLTSIPPLPDSLYFLSCENNLQLFCLPPLKKVNRFYFYHTGITCLPNYPQGNVYSNPSLNTVQLCDAFNPSSCDVYWNITGKVFQDSMTNCTFNSGEPTYDNLKVQLYNGGNLQQEVFTNSDGSYSFDTNYGTYAYSIDSSNIPFTVSCPVTSFQTSSITALDSMDFNMDFGLRCKIGFDLQARSIEGRFIPGNTRYVSVTAGDAAKYYGAYCALGVSGAVTVTINGSAHYTAPAIGALTPTVNGNTLTYTIADFGAANFFTDFNIMVLTDTTAVLGSHICITVSVTPTTGDNNPANNTLTICFPVVGSYDPNDKTAYPAGDIDAAQKDVTYTVRFQNTGTAEAQHIYITDTLDTDIDESTFQLLAYSHQPMVQIEQNRVRFNFPNINLPDSNTNEPLSHGYVQYKVKMKDNLPIGTQINNTAHIYFDFNAPVVTNTTSNTITTNTAVTSLSIQHSQFSIYPNPAKNSFTVSIPENLIGEKLTITDITGKQMAAVQLQTANSKLVPEEWVSGVYFVRIRSAVAKLFLQK